MALLNEKAVAFGDALGSTEGDEDSFVYDKVGKKLSLRNSDPQGMVHFSSVRTSGTVGDGAVIIGKPNATADVGDNCVILHGEDSGATCSGDRSLSIGGAHINIGDRATCLGWGNTAGGDEGAVSIGRGTSASASFSVGIGTECGVSNTAGTASVGVGFFSIANSKQSFSFGTRAKTLGTDYQGNFLITDSQSVNTSAIEKDHFMLRFDKGMTLTKNGNTGPRVDFIQEEGATTSGDKKVLMSYPVSNNTIYFLRLKLTAVVTGGLKGFVGDSYIKEFVAKVISVSGGKRVTKVRRSFEDRDNKRWKSRLSVDDSNINFTVSGSEDVSMKWNLYAEIHPVSLD